MSKTKRKSKAKLPAVEEPAKITDDHVQNRAYVIELGEMPAQRKAVVAPG